VDARGSGPEPRRTAAASGRPSRGWRARAAPPHPAPRATKAIPCVLHARQPAPARHSAAPPPAAARRGGLSARRIPRCAAARAR
jgi:hypothetical protein